MSRVTLLVLFCAVMPLLAQPASEAVYRITFDPDHDITVLEKSDTGQPGLFVKVKFTVSVEGTAPSDPNTQYKILVEENGFKVHEDDVPRPTPTEDLSVVLAMDTSGSMKEHGRFEKARAAADLFLTRLPTRGDCGLVLFDHEIREPTYPPQLDRRPLLQAVRGIQPRGGTAYLDAASRAIQLLSSAPSHKQRSLVLMTDGVDLNSNAELSAVIQQARAAKVKVFTIGIGEPGKQEPVSTVLVLDHSGSMNAPAEAQERTPKIKALHKAASRFVAIMPTTGNISILPFSTMVGLPREFSNNKPALIRHIQGLQGEGETAILDATYAAVATLDASGRPGKRAVVAMTDGIDNSSRRRVDEVIARAKEAGISLYMLGFGREGELDSRLMRQMAEETRGRYYHAKNEQALLDIFENLSIQLHDDGIDEITLTKLAQETGGRYYPVKDVAKLDLILKQISEAIQHKAYEVTFPSLLQKRDGTRRTVALKLVRRTGEIVSNTAGGSFVAEEVIGRKESGYQTRGLVLAEMHPLVYLVLLLGIGVLLLLPSMTRHLAGGRRG